MFPTLVLFGLAGVVNAMLNAFDEFFVPALAPVAWNVVIVAVLVGASPLWHSIDDRLYAYAVGILAGTAVQFALPLPLLRGRGGRLSLTLDTSDPLVRRVFALMLPVSLGLGLININLLIDTWFATRVNAKLAPAAIDKAFRIYMLPQGMFSVAVATVAFPALSRAASARDGRAYRRTLATALRQIAFLLVPASVAIAVLSQPMVRLVFQHGRFDDAPDARRRPGARRLRVGTHLQRRHVDVEPRVLQPADALGADAGGRRDARRERRARRALLPAVRRAGGSRSRPRS